MRLYSRIGATAADDAGDHYEPGPDGAFDFPDDVAVRLHGYAIGGVPMWEDEVERQQRLIAAEIERRKDPATLLDAVQQIVKAAQAVAPQAAPEPVPAAPAATLPAPAAAPQPAQADSPGGGHVTVIGPGTE